MSEISLSMLICIRRFFINYTDVKSEDEPTCLVVVNALIKIQNANCDMKNTNSSPILIGPSVNRFSLSSKQVQFAVCKSEG